MGDCPKDCSRPMLTLSLRQRMSGSSLEPTAGRCKPARANAVQHTWPSSVATHRSMVLCFDSRPAGSVTIELLIKLSKPLRDFLLADASKRGDCCQVLAARRRFACLPSVDRLPGRTHEPAKLFSAQAQALAIFSKPRRPKAKTSSIVLSLRPICSSGLHAALGALGLRALLYVGQPPLQSGDFGPRRGELLPQRLDLGLDLFASNASYLSLEDRSEVWQLGLLWVGVPTISAICSKLGFGNKLGGNLRCCLEPLGEMECIMRRAPA